jgi:hypothetical protein
VGRVYQQTFLDTYTKLAFAKLYDRKTPLVAADLLNDRVIPFFDQHGLTLQRVLTDRSTEYCGGPERHEYELYLAVENIDHTRTKVKKPADQGLRFILHFFDALPSDVGCGLPPGQFDALCLARWIGVGRLVQAVVFIIVGVGANHVLTHVRNTQVQKQIPLPKAELCGCEILADLVSCSPSHAVRKTQVIGASASSLCARSTLRCRAIAAV